MSTEYEQRQENIREALGDLIDVSCEGCERNCGDDAEVCEVQCNKIDSILSLLKEHKMVFLAENQAGSLVLPVQLAREGFRRVLIDEEKSARPESR